MILQATKTEAKLALPKIYLVPSVLIGIFLTLIGFHLSPEGGELWKVVSNRALAVISIGVSAVLGAYVVKVFEKYRSIAAELKILEGYLRICASCKDIKTEDNTWEKLESYISKNSEAQFTHSICPKCSKQMFNEVGL